jgi:hypothetical protein
MNLERYDYQTNETFLDYEFHSEGPKGAIKKVVRFTLVQLPMTSFYNLGFGDWNEEQKRIDDFVITNNKDAERVLATVANTVIDFTNHYLGVIIYAEGSTLSRTRRYQMGINKYWHEIEPLFDVAGLVENEGFQPFVKGINYKAFAVKRKN